MVAKGIRTSALSIASPAFYREMTTLVEDMFEFKCAVRLVCMSMYLSPTN